MKYGVAMFPTDQAIAPTDLAKAVEDRGFESLFFPEHSHIPASRRSAWPRGGELPEMYWHAHDPFVALGMAAAVTERLRLGTGICLVIERDTIMLAKEVATLDFLSGGRFLFGIGGGWNYEEMENHGTNPKTRWRKLREQIAALKEIWTKDAPEYHGQFVNFDPIWQWPKPAQQPHPPILVGGSGPRTLERVVEYGDGWMPVAGRNTDPIEEKIAELNERAAAAGRGSIPVSLFEAPSDAAILERYKSAGVERCIFAIPSANADRVLPRLDRLAELAASVG